MKIIIKGNPKGKQSFRFTKKGIKYQPKEVKQREENIQWQVINQLPKDFQPFDCPLWVTKLHYIFAPLKSFSKRKLRAIESDEIIFKDTKPDLTDNLAKLVFDALEGIVYINDSKIVAMDNVRKYYGLVPRIEIEIVPMGVK